MAEKDLISKEILKRLAVDIAQILFGLNVSDAEILETEYQTIEDRRADLVARMWGEEGDFISMSKSRTTTTQPCQPGCCAIVLRSSNAIR